MKTSTLVDTINKLGKSVFTIKDLRRLFPGELNIKTPIKRLVDREVLVKITRGIYRLKNTTIDLESLATQIYFPSYLSFENVLSKYGVINQGANKITLATTRHSKKILLSGIECEYIQLKPTLFFGFSLSHGVYVAGVEKALLDEVYLMSLGRRKVNPNEWNLDALDPKIVKKYAKLFPPQVNKLLKEFFC
ncbi:hypothetical protein COS78_03505 [Candidatus Shapirobacteria bacterium CG06_land_8_20_14_3_00_40_12]|uniref:Transcriptional regulator n=2 Tax=Candidatus Shapironibacteriota TaxID=1752721 RepID=A0A2M7TTP8_9BACT|nr:MAG: hypothetical protein COS78_03505 [Candidatus Shapirobacteria bacterium CG06_land_8_20_14_3_00_40_12]PIZ60320.1 MAG: hypothetical protein COY20_01290 [Candidatus Shapirobacteria bacterium CG_4_10_14_0_2_um_filter_40_12]